MTFDDQWKKFIQVNIYGQTIEDLQRNGIVLKNMLNDIGCSKVWIVEGSMYSGDDFQHPSTDYNDLSVTAPVLSTTIAEVKCPRFSTPAVPQVPLNSKFTLNLPVKLSEIHEDDDDEQETKQEFDLQEVLDELIEKVTEQQEQEEEISEEEEEEPEIVNPEKTEQQEKAILSTTIIKTELPRYSTPIRPDEAFTMNITETLSDIESDDDDVVISDQSFQHEEEQQEPEPVIKKPKRSTRSVSIMSPLNRRRSRRLSAPNLKAVLENVTTKEPKRKRPALKQSTTERKSSQRIQLKSSNSIHPKIAVTVRDTVKENPIEEGGSSAFATPPDLSFQSVRSRANSFIELKPVTRFSSVAPFDSDAPSTSAQAAAAANRQNIAAPELDFDYDYDGGRQQEDTMVMGYQYEEVVGEEEGGWEGDEEEEVEKRMEFNARASKKVSFAEPLIQNTQKDKVHLVKCYYEGCDKSYTWRKKYGKIRLVDHAMSHVPELVMKCDYCDHTCKGIRQIRYHHKRMHPNTKLERFGVKRMMNTSEKDTDFSKIWDQCYKKNLVIDQGNMNPFDRVDKGTRRRSKQNSAEVDEMAEDGEEAPFYFFRIR